jgi:hypothetical protein
VTDEERIADRREERLIKAAMWASFAAPAAVFIVHVLLNDAAEILGFLFSLVWIGVVASGAAFAHVLLIGLPLYLLLAKRWRISWWMCAGAGAVIGALPVPLILFYSVHGSAPSAWELVGIVPPFAGAGLVGGAVFGLKMRAGERSAR